MTKYRNRGRGRLLNPFHSLRLKKSNRPINDFSTGETVEIRLKDELRGETFSTAGTVHTGVVVSANALMVKIRFADHKHQPKYFSPYYCFKPGDV